MSVKRLTKAERRALLSSLRAPIKVGRRCVVVGTAGAELFERRTIDALTARGLLHVKPSATLRMLSPAGREIAERLRMEART